MAKLQMEETKQEEVIWEGQEVEESQRPHETSETDRRLLHPAQTSAETECDETDIDAKEASPWSQFRTLKQSLMSTLGDGARDQTASQGSQAPWMPVASL